MCVAAKKIEPGTMSGCCRRSSLTRSVQVDDRVGSCAIVAEYGFESKVSRSLASVDSRRCEMVDADTGSARCALSRLGIVLKGMGDRNRLNANQQRNKRHADDPTGLSEYAAHDCDNYDSKTEN